MTQVLPKLPFYKKQQTKQSHIKREKCSLFIYYSLPFHHHLAPRWHLPERDATWRILP